MPEAPLNISRRNFDSFLRRRWIWCLKRYGSSMRRHPLHSVEALVEAMTDA